MPGHLIETSCDCGFTNLLSPGAGVQCGYDMAYTEAGDDLQTFEDVEIANRQLITISNPFLEEPSSADDEKWSEFFKRRYEPQGPHRCPKCRRDSLILRFRGRWD
jgi:hypothetical protein